MTTQQPEQPSELQQIFGALNTIGEKLTFLTEQISELNINFAKQNVEVKFIKDEIEQIHVHGAQMDRKIEGIFYKNQQQDKRISLLEEDTRKYNIVIRNVPEGRPDNLKQRVLKWMNDFGSVEYRTADLVSAFRIGYKRQNGANRNALVRFANLGDKLEVMEKIRELKGVPNFEGKEIQVFPDISKEERSWRFFLKPVTKVLRDKDIRYNWRPLQQLKFFYKGRMQTITPETDVIKLIRDLGLIEKDEELAEIKEHILKMGGIQEEPSTSEETGAVGGDPKTLKRKEISPAVSEHKKIREDTERTPDKEEDLRKKQEAECGAKPKLSSFFESGT